MSLRQTLFTLATAAGLASAAPSPQVEPNWEISDTCPSISTRVAWHTLTDEEKSAFVDASLCLLNTPSTIEHPGITNQFNALQWVHIEQGYFIHGVGGFLPYHRAFISAHEVLLRHHCQYTGPYPYWDEARDAGAFSKSVVFDPDTGFGGDGRPEDLCVTDGPFSGIVQEQGPWYEIGNSLCLTREINDTLSASGDISIVNECLKQDTYLGFDGCLIVPHLAGHQGSGGTMNDVLTSPGDPLFYMHHAYIDKIWWDWQQIDVENRTVSVSGSNRPSGTGFGGLLFREEDMNVASIPGDEGDETTLTHILDFMGLLPNLTVADTLRTDTAPMCFEYI